MDKLILWKDKEGRKPLLLYGARQVGKTHILREFGESFYKNTIYINLELEKAVATYFSETLDPEKIIRNLEVYKNEEITPDQTLIILDEVQTSEEALNSLKYFYELAPEYHVVAAGSLAGVAINREKYSFPVGKVETFTLYPFDYEEFLWAMGEQRLCATIKECFENVIPMVEGLHQKALELYRMYLIIGGMPACINEYLKRQKLIDVPLVALEILNDYIADMAKYASAKESVKIRACFNSVPTQLGKQNKKFQYKVVQRGGSASFFGESIDWLTLAGVVLKCQKITQGNEPIAAYMDLPSFKLYSCDTGLFVAQSGMSQHTILSDEENNFLGALVENYVATQLVAKGYPLYYWESEHTAELDFVLQKENIILGIEVKKGQHIKSRSLTLFGVKYPKTKKIRISSKNFGHTDSITSIPLYSIFCL